MNKATIPPGSLPDVREGFWKKSDAAALWSKHERQ